MKSILLSLPPKQVANILNGKQTAIVRKTALALIVYAIVINIQRAYKKHSKKYAWDCVRGKYVKKEDLGK